MTFPVQESLPNELTLVLAANFLVSRQKSLPQPLLLRTRYTSCSRPRQPCDQAESGYPLTKARYDATKASSGARNGRCLLASQYHPPFRPGDFEKWAAENSLLLDDPLA